MSLVARSLRHRYQKGRETIDVLNGVDLEAAPGEMIALLGPSGSGKSTLMRLLSGLEKPKSGEIELDGLRLDRLADRKLGRIRRDAFGVLFQDGGLVPTLSASENVVLPMLFGGGRVDGETSARAEALLQRFGLDPGSRRSVRKMSVGERQRVALARALIRKPTYLFCDEPTARLDRHQGSKVLEALRELADHSAVCVILSTHDLEGAKRAHRRLTLRDGLLES